MQRWSDEEKVKLKQLATQSQVNGRIQWDFVVKEFPNRSKDQLRAYYMLYHASGQVNTEWTLEQKWLLYQAVQQFGTKWSIIKKQLFPKLQTAALRMQYRRLVSRFDAIHQVSVKLLNNEEQQQTNILILYRIALENQYILEQFRFLRQQLDQIFEPILPYAIDFPELRQHLQTCVFADKSIEKMFQIQADVIKMNEVLPVLKQRVSATELRSYLESLEMNGAEHCVLLAMLVSSQEKEAEQQ